MAQISNPRKEFNFSIQIVGAPINPFLVQEVQLPDIDIEQIEHGDTNYDVKTGGRIKFGNLQLEKIMTTSGADNYMFDWAISVADAQIGGGSPPSVYWRTVMVKELAEDGTSAINTWICTGCWPTKINGQKLSRKSSDNSMEKLELSVNRCEKI